MPLSRTQHIVRLLAGMLLVGGAALALWALTLPWDHFEPPPGLGLPPGPPAFIPAQDYVRSTPTVLGVFYVCPPLALGLFGLIEVLRLRVLWRTRVIAGILLASLGLALTFLLAVSGGFLNDSVYKIVADPGVNVSYLGYACALVGSVVSVPWLARFPARAAGSARPERM